MIYVEGLTNVDILDVDIFFAQRCVDLLHVDAQRSGCAFYTFAHIFQKKRTLEGLSRAV